MRWGAKVETNAPSRVRRDDQAEFERLISTHGAIWEEIGKTDREHGEVERRLAAGAPPRPDEKLRALNRRAGGCDAAGDLEGSAAARAEAEAVLEGYLGEREQHRLAQPALAQRAADLKARLEDLRAQLEPITDALHAAAEKMFGDLNDPHIEKLDKDAVGYAQARAEVLGIRRAAAQARCAENLWSLEPGSFEIQRSVRAKGVLPVVPASDGPAARAEAIVARLRACGFLNALAYQPKNSPGVEHVAGGLVADSA